MLLSDRVKRALIVLTFTTSALTKMDHAVLIRMDPGGMSKITRWAAALAA